MRTNKMFGRVAVCAVSLTSVLAYAGSAKAEGRTHDGFYLSFNAGLGYVSSSAENNGVKASVSGVSLPSAIWLGGTVGPVVIGGGFFGDYVISPGAEVNGNDVDLAGDPTMTLVGLGAFADIYPDIHGGFHVMPFIGWGGLSTSDENGSGGDDPTGLVTSIGVGYDFWVAPEWSLGVMGRFAYAPLKVNDVSWSTIAPAVLFTVTYH